MRERIGVQAVQSKELRSILDRFCLTEPLESGELHCPSCNTVLSWDNIGGFVILGGKPKLFCSAADCLASTRQETSNG